MSNQSGYKDVYIVDGRRTPFLKVRGKPGPFSASDLAVLAGRAVLEEMPFKPDNLDEVIMGCVIPGPNEANIARTIALRLGCGWKVPAWTVQRNCASGMQALDCAAKNISDGRADLILAGGTEAMSHSPLLLNQKMVEWIGSWAKAKDVKTRIKLLSTLRPGHFKPVIALICGLTDPLSGLSMGQTAEIIANRFNITREEMDNYSMESHTRLAYAQDNHYLNELVTIYDKSGNYYNLDEGLRRDTDMESLGKLKAVFDPHSGKVTAGNSAQVTDGATMLLLASKEAVKKYSLPVLGKIIDCRWSALDPSQMGLGPSHAVVHLLKKNRLSKEDIHFWEINEAFAAQVLSCFAAWNDPVYCKEELGLNGIFGEIPFERVNVDGGGISLGHPIGASGARVVLHLLHVLAQHDAKLGIATLCIGGGQGGAMLVERCKA